MAVNKMRPLMKSLLFHILFGKEGDVMMAMLWAQSIILGKKTFSQVPKLLKEKVREILIDSGMEELIDD